LSNSLTFPRVFQYSKFDRFGEGKTNRTDVEARYLVIDRTAEL
jgi:hypothetical protein